MLDEPDPRERFRDDPDPRKRYADVFINGEPVVSEPLDFSDDRPGKGKEIHPDQRSERDEFLKNSPYAHPMKPEDRLPEGEIQVTFIGKRAKPPKRPT